jgi:hypothetical protein
MYNIVTSRRLRVTKITGSKSDDCIYSVFISTSVRISIITPNYNAIAILHTFQPTVARALGSLSTSRLLATDLNTETGTSYHYEVFLPFPVQSFWNLGNQLKLFSAESEFESYVTTDGHRPVCLEIKHQFGAYEQIFFTIRQVRVCLCGVLSLKRGRVCRLQLLLASPAQSFSGPSPVELVTIFYYLRFETTLFVASYDSQGYGGSIRPRLHTC